MAAEKVGVSSLEEIRAKDGSLSIPLYVSAGGADRVGESGASYGGSRLKAALEAWLKSSRQVRQSIADVLDDRIDTD